MRIVGLLPRYPPDARVGAFLATHELLAALAAAGHDVAVSVRGPEMPGYNVDGVHVAADAADALVHADVVVVHAGDELGTAAARASGLPTVSMVHGHQEELAARLSGSSLVAFNSHASAAGYSGDHLVVRPQLRTGVTVAPGDRVTLVNLCEEKGGELLWRIARNLPDVAFLAVRGTSRGQLVDRAANVAVIGPTETMGDVYSRTRVLLMPSARESWGMTGVEALSCGIPVVAHPTAGLRESLGDAGIFVDREDAQGWIDQLERLRDDEQWEAAAAAARARFEELDLEADVGPFIEAVEAFAK